MGPALLPTPLSPARGLPVRPHPKMFPFLKSLAPDVFPSDKSAGFSPALAPASGSVFPRCLLFQTEVFSCRTRFPAVPRPNSRIGLCSQAVEPAAEAPDPSIDH